MSKSKDFKNINNKATFLQFQQQTLHDFSRYIESLSNSNDTYKKSVLLTSWIRDYQIMINRENGFKPQYLPVYPRGSVISVNLGYNIGSEHGGVHYCIVLNKKDSLYSPVLTVIPLSSFNPSKPIRDNQHYLGNDFYIMLERKIKKLQKECETELETLENLPKEVNDEQFLETMERIKYLTGRLIILHDTEDYAKGLKPGSVALLNQITTISKIRIVSPINTKQPLYGITLPEETMEIITNKILSLY